MVLVTVLLTSPGSISLDAHLTAVRSHFSYILCSCDFVYSTSTITTYISHRASEAWSVSLPWSKQELGLSLTKHVWKSIARSVIMT